jgi:hypothetical protein
MGAFKYVAAVTVCTVLYVGYFLMLQTSVAFQQGTTPEQKLLVALVVGLLPAVILAGVSMKEFEFERFVGRTVVLAGLGAGIGWLVSEGLFRLSAHVQ